MLLEMVHDIMALQTVDRLKGGHSDGVYSISNCDIQIADRLTRSVHSHVLEYVPVSAWSILLARRPTTSTRSFSPWADRKAWSRACRPRTGTLALDTRN